MLVYSNIPGLSRKLFPDSSGKACRIGAVFVFLFFRREKPLILALVCANIHVLEITNTTTEKRSPAPKNDMEETNQ